MEIKSAYLAFEGFEKDLEYELNHHYSQKVGRLYLSTLPLQSFIWAQDSWSDLEILNIDSIQDASKKLKKMSSHWCFYSPELHRRSQLICEQIRKTKNFKFNFLDPISDRPVLAFSLIEQNKILLAKKRSHPVPLGEVHFNENKISPPSRAYMKLWEAMTIYKTIPNKNQTCIDFGSCPGGWTWVLSQVCQKVISIDKAPLDAKLSNIKNIQYIKADAFKLKPQDFKGVDWFFSDIICYPPKLLELVQLWMKESEIPNFVCTIKFQGATDFETMKNFLKIPNSKIIHLYHNKHEVTWIKLSDHQK